MAHARWGSFVGGPTVFGDMGLWLGGERYAVALCICGKVPGM